MRAHTQTYVTEICKFVDAVSRIFASQEAFQKNSAVAGFVSGLRADAKSALFLFARWAAAMLAIAGAAPAAAALCAHRANQRVDEPCSDQNKQYDRKRVHATPPAHARPALPAARSATPRRIAKAPRSATIFCPVRALPPRRRRRRACTTAKTPEIPAR